MSARRAVVAAGVGLLCALSASASASAGTGGGGSTDAYIDDPHPNAPAQIVGVAEVGQTLTVVYDGQVFDTSTMVTPHPLDGPYQWSRCDARGESCVPIATSSQPTYVVQAQDVASTLRVAVRAIGRGGSFWAVSTPTPVIKSAGSASADPAASGQAPPTGASEPAKGDSASLSVAVFNTTPQARAGRSFAARLRLPAAVSAEAGVVVRCSARLGRRALVGRASFADGVARCAWRLPARAAGLRLTGSMQVRYRSASVRRSFALRVR